MKCNENPSAITAICNPHTKIMYYYISCVELLRANLCSQSAGLCCYFSFHFRLLAGALSQRDLVPKIKQGFDCLLVFLFGSFDFVWQTSYGGFMNREQALRVSPLKQSKGLSRKYFIFYFLEHAFAI